MCSRGKVVAVHGSYYANNFGDTLLVKILCDAVAERIGKENVFLAHQGHVIEQKYIGYPVISKRKKSEVTHLLYSGGGYLGEPKGSYLEKVKWSLRNYKRHFKWSVPFKRAKKSFIGVGFGPLSILPFRFFLKRKMADSVVTVLRDKESIEYFNLYGFTAIDLSQSVDFALSLKSDSGKKGSSIIGIHIDKQTKEVIEYVFKAIAESNYRNEKIEIFFDTGVGIGDEIKNKYLAAFDASGLTATLSFVEYDGVDNLINRLKRYQFVITSKLHVGIVSIALDGKVISIPVHQKTLRLYTQLGIDYYCMYGKKVDAASIKERIDRIEEFEPNKATIANGIKVINDSIDKALN